MKKTRLLRTALFISLLSLAIMVNLAVPQAAFAAVPGAPSLLTATAAGANQVNLAWVDGASDESGFRIERALNDTFTTGKVSFIVGANAISYIDTTVAAATLYFYRVYAVNASGDSAPSNTATVTTPTASSAAPVAPSQLAAVLVNNARVDLSWQDNSNNETGFRIETATNPNFNSGNVTFAVGANVTSYSDTSVYAGDTFYYRVVALGALISSSPSNVVSVTIQLLATSPPGAPTNLTASVVSPTKIDLSWTQNSGGITQELSFIIDRASESTFEQNLATFVVPQDTVTYSDTTAVAGQTYFYRVKASNALGNSETSNIVTASTLGSASAAPGTPNNLAATPVNFQKVDLNWTITAGAEQPRGYIVDRANDIIFIMGLVTYAVPSDETTYSDTSVAPAQTYFFRIRAIYAAGTSTYSNITSVTTPAAPAGWVPPLAPTPTPTPTPTPYTYAPYTPYTPPAPVYTPPPAPAPAPTPNPALNRAAPTPAPSPTTKMTPAPASAPPAPVILTPIPLNTSPVTAPVAPTALLDEYLPSVLAARGGTRTITLTWHDNCSTERGFYIERSLDGKNWNRIDRLDRDTDSYTDKGMYGQANLLSKMLAFLFGGLDSDTTYYYRLQVFNETGTSNYTSLVSARTK